MLLAALPSTVTAVGGLPQQPSAAMIIISLPADELNEKELEADTVCWSSEYGCIIVVDDTELDETDVEEIEVDMEVEIEVDMEVEEIEVEEIDVEVTEVEETEVEDTMVDDRRKPFDPFVACSCTAPPYVKLLLPLHSSMLESVAFCGQ